MKSPSPYFTNRQKGSSSSLSHNLKYLSSSLSHNLKSPSSFTQLMVHPHSFCYAPNSEDAPSNRTIPIPLSPLKGLFLSLFCSLNESSSFHFPTTLINGSHHPSSIFFLLYTPSLSLSHTPVCPSHPYSILRWVFFFLHQRDQPFSCFSHTLKGPSKSLFHTPRGTILIPLPHSKETMLTPLLYSQGTILIPLPCSKETSVLIIPLIPQRGLPAGHYFCMDPQEGTHIY